MYTSQFAPPQPLCDDDRQFDIDYPIIIVVPDWHGFWHFLGSDAELNFGMQSWKMPRPVALGGLAACALCVVFSVPRRFCDEQ